MHILYYIYTFNQLLPIHMMSMYLVLDRTLFHTE